MASRMVVIWLVPAAAALTTLAGNVWMAVAYAAALAQLGITGAATSAGGWLAFFGLLGANNMLLLLILARWLGTREQEERLRAEVVAAMKWRERRWAGATAVQEGFVPPAVRGRRGVRFGSYYLTYCCSFFSTMIAPAAIMAAITLG